MKKLFKRILVSTFVIGASLFIGNNVFAENYKVNIAVVGDASTGKTQILNRISDKPFEDQRIRTDWEHGAGGRQKQYHIGDDVFECYYYDAPGYLKNPDATLDQQIESAAIRNANIALIVVDPQQTVGIAPHYVNGSIQEAFARHALHVFSVNPNCKIIVVANKIDKIDKTILDKKLAEYQGVMDHGNGIYGYLNADSVFTSAKEGTGISELEEKITKLLALNKATFPTFDNSFVVCQRDGCGRRQRVCDGCVQGFMQDWYCGDGCLTLAEAKSCSRQDCTHKDRKFLRCRGEGFTNPRTGKMYCDHDTCYRLDVGEPCSYPHCPHPDARYLRDEQQGFVSQHTNKMYCDATCYRQGEGKKCDHEGCGARFVIADGQGGVDFYTHPKNGKMYCPKHSKDATPGCTLL